jgi:hypothetical protein
LGQITRSCSGKLLLKGEKIIFTGFSLPAGEMDFGKIG